MTALPFRRRKMRSLRIRAGMNITALALAANTSKSYISEIESGKRTPGLDVLHRIARALRVDVGVLCPAAIDEESADVPAAS
jgi:transcriptional regulator with XRE-family HTH domain